MRVFDKINIFSIISEHIKTLVNDNTKKHDSDDWITFLLVPLVAAALLMFFGVKLNDQATNIIITSLSILVGLLFNVIVIIFDIIQRDSEQRTKNRVLKQTLTNILYSIVISISVIAIILLTYIPNNIIKDCATFIVYFFIGNYFMTVLMIVKRMYKLFTNELNEIENKNGSGRN